jgi:hypothetical protein
VEHPLFSFYLHQSLLSKGLKPVDVANTLGYRKPHIMKAWLEGDSLPLLSELVPIADAIDIDPVEMVAIWIIDQCPALEPVLWAEVLWLRWSKAPKLDDPLIHEPRLEVKFA